jgi:hypothetical protein
MKTPRRGEETLSDYDICTFQAHARTSLPFPGPRRPTIFIDPEPTAAAVFQSGRLGEAAIDIAGRFCEKLA